MSNIVKLFKSPLDSLTELIQEWKPDQLILVGIKDNVFDVYHTPFSKVEILGALEMAKHEILNIGDE